MPARLTRRRLLSSSAATVRLTRFLWHDIGCSHTVSLPPCPYPSANASLTVSGGRRYQKNTTVRVVAVVVFLSSLSVRSSRRLHVPRPSLTSFARWLARTNETDGRREKTCDERRHSRRLSLPFSRRSAHVSDRYLYRTSCFHSRLGTRIGLVLFLTDAIAYRGGLSVARLPPSSSPSS